MEARRIWNKMNVSFNYTSLPTELANQVQEAIDNNVPFGLTNGRTVSLFDPVNLMGAWFGQGRMVRSGPTAFNYPNIDALIQGVSMALLSQKTFVPASNLLSYCQQNRISIPTHLLSENK